MPRTGSRQALSWELSWCIASRARGRLCCQHGQSSASARASSPWQRPVRVVCKASIRKALLAPAVLVQALPRSLSSAARPTRAAICQAEASVPGQARSSARPILPLVGCGLAMVAHCVAHQQGQPEHYTIPVPSRTPLLASCDILDIKTDLAARGNNVLGGTCLQSQAGEAAGALVRGHVLEGAACSATYAHSGLWTLGQEC